MILDTQSTLVRSKGTRLGRKIQFSDGLLKTIEWYLDNLDWCKEIQKESGYDGQRLGFNQGK